MEFKIIPSILVETAEEYSDRIEVAEDFAEYIHWDVMDGQFVESITFGDPAHLSNVDTVLNIGAHLMVEAPEEYLEKFAKAGVDRLIVHAQVVNDLPGIVEKMKSYSFETGIALSTEVDIDVIDEVVNDIDMVLVMTVVPGKAGQDMIPEELDKVRELRKKYPDLNIGVDGGMNMNTVVKAKEAGANYFSVNSAIFESPDPVMAFETLKSLIA